MSVISKESLTERLQNKAFRSEYVSAHVRTGIAQQIRTLRNSRGWSQGDLGTYAEKPQSVIARLENPDYGKFSVQSLLELASAFDVALVVRFVRFGEFIASTRNLSPSDLAVSSFEEDTLENHAEKASPLADSSDTHKILRALIELDVPKDSAARCFASSRPVNATPRAGHLALPSFIGERPAHQMAPEIAARALEK